MDIKIILQMIKYNKTIQKKLKITLEEYKSISSSYIINSEDITKIYRKGINSKIFEGKYEKGEKIEGIEYKDDKKYFIGEFKNNLRYKGKTLNKYGKLIFEGEYKDGLFWEGNLYNPSNKQITGKLNKGCGKIIKEYNFEGNEIFKGIYKDGKRYSGIEYNNKNKKIYEGEYKGNKRWKGYFYSPKEDIKYEIKEGNGIIKEYDINENLIYEGEYKYGIKYNGKGKEYYNYNGIIKFEGKYENGFYNEGIYYDIYMNEKFIGKFINGIKLEGLLYKYNPNNYENIFYYGQFNKGKKYYGIEINDIGGFRGYFYANGNYYKGKYYIGDFDIENKKNLLEKNELKELKEDELKNKGNIKFNGEFLSGRFYKGKEYNNYQKSGYFQKYNKIIFEGEYKDGQYWNGKSYKVKDIYSRQNEGFYGTYKNGVKKGEETIYDGDGELIMRKKYFDVDDYDYEYYNDGKIIEGKLIGGCSAHIIELKIMYEKEKFLSKKKKIIYKAFEGKYMNNKRYIGIEYDKNGNIIFEGEYQNGKYYYGNKYSGKNDKDKYNCLLFEGEFKDGYYYKGKEYYNLNEIDNEQDFSNENENILYFEGLYENGKKYIGMEYNYHGNIIFIGKYKSGLYWDGYFYEEGEVMHQKKSGNIINGEGKNIKLYDINGKIKFKGDFKEGKYYTGEGKLIKEEFGEIKDIDINDPYDKKIKKIISYNGKFKNGIFINGDKSEKYIIIGENDSKDEDLETFI